MPLTDTLPAPLNHIHIMGIGGTAMAALAGMLVDAGYTVTGSDGGVVYPPMSDYLTSIGITPEVGYKKENLSTRPDLVVVGNVVRAVFEEAVALLDSDIPYMSFPSLLGAQFLEGIRSIVVAGTHGKTTTTSLGAWMLTAAGRDPGFLIGGLAANFDRTARASGGEHFIIEGDEYDTAFFDKGPKFLHYRPTTAIITSIEFDHADIYRDLAHCQESFRKLVKILPSGGCLVARWDSDAVVEVVAELDPDQGVEIRRYGPGQDWDGRIDSVDTVAGTMTFTVLHKGAELGSFTSTMVGEHNLYNQVAMIAALQFEGLTPAEMAEGLASFKGIKRRQEVIGEIGGVTVLDDFAHHPTAVRVTLNALRLRFGGRRIWAIFEPRSSTSRRAIFQKEYAEAFGASDIVVIAPPYDQTRIATEERMDAGQLVDDLHANGSEAFLWGGAPEGVEDWNASRSAQSIADQVITNVQSEDVVAVLSNGGFGGLHQKLLSALNERFSS